MSKVIKQCDELIKNAFNETVDFDYITDMTSHIMHSKEYKNLVKNDIFPITYKLTAHKYSYKKVVMYSVGVNFYYDSLTLNDDQEKISAKYKDKEYKKELTKEVLEQLKIVPLLWPTELEMPATYYPIMTAMTSLKNYLYYLNLQPFIKTHPDYKDNTIDDFKVASFRQILLTTESALNQLTNGDCWGARASIRILIEDYFIYALLRNNEEGIKEYVRYTDAQREYDLTKKFSNEFLNSIPEDVRDPKKAIKYVDYGWLRRFSKKQKAYYTAVDLIYLARGMETQEKSSWVDVYLNFSKHSHGELLEPNRPVVEILGASSYIAELLSKTAKLFEEDFQMKTIYDGVERVDLIYRLQEKIDELQAIFKESKLFDKENQ